MTALQEWQQETQDIISSLLNDGSNPDVEYTIEHHFSGANFDRLEKAAIDCFKAGLEVSDAEELEVENGHTVLCFDAIKEGPLNETAIMAQIESLLKIAEKHQVEYDGWGTYFEE
ncbi:ribonuclease E inhibitor RraB [Oceanisphaera pacifica]|uniref:Regulator of ribonuclease activity B n=1 Tax=Oceanisphaera pacifica TaxID=2818389 RepID=A0ABS3NFG8_9GAMM|nr:ribonuclease E inhibitor RraB [Oceanisphaera pacifica]MBO1519307.1 ribonuclease E inhibitor RraB [Oceanisphaera pacifica]